MNPSPPRKTLSLKKPASAAHEDAREPQRKRSGARARQVALQARAQNQAPEAPTAGDDRRPQPRPARSRRTEHFDLFAPCPQGLEQALALELEALGYEGVREGRAGCHFRAD